MRPAIKTTPREHRAQNTRRLHVLFGAARNCRCVIGVSRSLVARGSDCGRHVAAGVDDLDEQQADSKRRGQWAMRFTTPRRVDMPPSNGPTAGRPDESQEETTKQTAPQQESPEADGPAHPTGEHQAQENRENESPA